LPKRHSSKKSKNKKIIKSPSNKNIPKSKAEVPKHHPIADIKEKYKEEKEKISHQLQKEKANIIGVLKSFKFHKHKDKGIVKPQIPEKKDIKIEDSNKKGIKAEVQLTGLPPISEAAQKIEKKEIPKHELRVPTPKKGDIKILGTYNFVSDNIPITIRVYKMKGEFVPIYDVSLSTISKNTEIILEKIREELTTQVSLGMVDILATKETGIIEQRFIDTITNLINKHFPDADQETTNFLKSYLIQRSLGLGNIEILMDDADLEEIAINSADEPVWVYHKKFGWLKTNIMLSDEEQTRHYATMIGRRVGRQLTILEPLMDAHLKGGDRVNATIEPVSVGGNTITLRKFAAKPWTITDFIKDNTISAEAAALIWLGVQFELSTLIAGGTATGKTSMLNVVANFFPPNQRILSIEDTREIQLPKFLHWVPMVTRLPNPEGKGEVSMLDLLVNSLRMRPDRILVGEIRRKREAEVLFEAIHTGHSVYATVHANDANETITRLTNPPIEIPKTMLPAISMIVVQYRNRRTGVRKTFQIAEILPNSEPNILIQLDIRKGILKKVANSKSLIHTIEMFTGFSRNELKKSLKEKVAVLKWLVKRDVNTVNSVGRVIAEYYTNKDNLMHHVKKNKVLGD
jgi:flagellar protein FlaI|tara:strand:- start:3549 stop:5438 length:1890 start_codon:yes stop_codon:yes gene_type:complete